ncbi:hypothetical protein NX059_010632 [Plenodomus lindquistii]|nr:hypothetical protein NX059_010632 [Plenodomus lindquistii]
MTTPMRPQPPTPLEEAKAMAESYEFMVKLAFRAWEDLVDSLENMRRCDTYRFWAESSLEFNLRFIEECAVEPLRSNVKTIINMQQAMARLEKKMVVNDRKARKAHRVFILLRK